MLLFGLFRPVDCRTIIMLAKVKMREIPDNSIEFIALWIDLINDLV